MNSNKSVLLERYRLNAEQNELASTLNYLQLRNRDLVRDWRTKLALSARQNQSPGSGGLGFAERALRRFAMRVPSTT